MKHLKRYSKFFESLMETDVEVNNLEKEYSEEYPNVRFNGKRTEDGPKLVDSEIKKPDSESSSTEI